jgi:uncharacterized protein (UPF0264 family)
VDAVAGRRPISAVIAEPEMDPEVMLRTAVAIAESGATYIKLGLIPKKSLVIG